MIQSLLAINTLFLLYSNSKDKYLRWSVGFLFLLIMNLAGIII